MLLYYITHFDGQLLQTLGEMHPNSSHYHILTNAKITEALA